MAALAKAVFGELERLGETIATRRSLQPFAVVARDGRVLAGNRPLLELLGCDKPDLLGSLWDSVMPSWREVVDRSRNEPEGARLYARRFNAPLHVAQRNRGRATVLDLATTVRTVPGDGEEPMAFTFLLSPLSA